MESVINVFCINQGKSYENLSTEEKAMLADIMYDMEMGHTPIMVDMSPHEIFEFKVFITKHGDDYSTLTDAERWCYEDLYIRTVLSKNGRS